MLGQSFSKCSGNAENRTLRVATLINIPQTFLLGTYTVGVSGEQQQQQ